MSVLARYRKRGGFKQLLQLIETSQPAKQEKLLEAVKKEDPAWAELLMKKKLSFDMVMGWEDETLILILEKMIPRHCATLLFLMEDERREGLKSMFKMEKWVELKEIFENIENVLESEKISASNNLLETVRQLDEEKVILLRFIDPALEVEDAA